MSWFKRTNESGLQDDYLQTTETVSRPLATVFTILIVLVLAAVAFSLFLGGRWLFQHLDGSTQPKVTVVENPITVTTPSAASTSSSPSQPAPSTSNNGSSTNQPNPAPSSAPAATATHATTTTTASAQAIPATGPTDTIVIFIATVLIATIAHQLWQRRFTV